MKPERRSIVRLTAVALVMLLVTTSCRSAVAPAPPQPQQPQIERQPATPEVKVSLSGDTLNVRVEERSLCREGDGEWSPCDTHPLSQGLVRLTVGDQAMEQRTDESGSARFDLSQIKVQQSGPEPKYANVEVPWKHGVASASTSIEETSLHTAWKARASDRGQPAQAREPVGRNAAWERAAQQDQGLLAAILEDAEGKLPSLERAKAPWGSEEIQRMSEINRHLSQFGDAIPQPLASRHGAVLARVKRLQPQYDRAVLAERQRIEREAARREQERQMFRMSPTGRCIEACDEACRSLGGEEYRACDIQRKFCIAQCQK